MHVELNIFSGRPNPGWNLTTPERDELSKMLEHLSPSGAKTMLQGGGGLGYSGFRVSAGQDKADSVSDITIYRGIVSFGSGSGKQVLSDPSRNLEHWLLQTGKAHLDQKLFDYALAEIDKA